MGVVVKQNSADGYIHGIEVDLNYQYNQTLSGHADITWLEGRLTRDDFVDSFTQITESFSRIMPLSANLGVEWKCEDRSWWLGSNITLATKAYKLSEGDKDDTQRIPPGGRPSYQLVNINSGWQATQGLLLALQVNNIFDEAYRSHGSGSNEPGRNLILGSTLRF
jgi:hemoglobin/transferrin/lactoferrin receptor protein